MLLCKTMFFFKESKTVYPTTNCNFIILQTQMNAARLTFYVHLMQLVLTLKDPTTAPVSRLLLVMGIRVTVRILNEDIK